MIHPNSIIVSFNQNIDTSIKNNNSISQVLLISHIKVQDKPFRDNNRLSEKDQM